MTVPVDAHRVVESEHEHDEAGDEDVDPLQLVLEKLDFLKSELAVALGSLRVAVEGNAARLRELARHPLALRDLGSPALPAVRGVVPRAAAVDVRGLDCEGKTVEFAAEGFFARVLQHEVDHLDGVLFLDRMADFQTLAFVEEYQRYWLEETD